MWVLFASGCGGASAPQAAPEPTEASPAPIVAPLPWTPGRDAAGRFAIDWPAEVGGVQALERQLDGHDVTLFTVEAATTEAPRLKVSVGWVPFDPGDRSEADALAAGLAMAEGPDDAAATALGGRPALSWTSSNWSTQFSSAVVLGVDRLYVLRVSNLAKERLTKLHDRSLESFVVLGAADLRDEEVDATQTFLDMVASRAAAAEAQHAALEAARLAKEAAIAAGDRPSDADIVENLAMTRALGMYCLVGADPVATLRLSVSDGRVTSARVFEVIRSFSNNQPTPRERNDLLSACVLRYAKDWTFPDELSASGIEIPLVFGP